MALRQPCFLSLQILNDRGRPKRSFKAFSLPLEKARCLPEKGKFSSWLVLTRNRSIDRYRSRKRRTDKAENDEILVREAILPKKTPPTKQPTTTKGLTCARLSPNYPKNKEEFSNYPISKV